MRGMNLKRVYPKVERNEVCPCGSGKKFKYCCIKGEWINDYIDVYHGLLQRENKFTDLNDIPKFKDSEETSENQ